MSNFNKVSLRLTSNLLRLLFINTHTEPLHGDRDSVSLFVKTAELHNKQCSEKKNKLKIS